MSLTKRSLLDNLLREFHVDEKYEFLRVNHNVTRYEIIVEREYAFFHKYFHVGLNNWVNYL